MKIFDSHFHIIEKDFPLIQNQGYIPQAFTCDDYLDKMDGFQLMGGAIVSGSFQGFDQSYLISALSKLGPSFVGVTQLPDDVSDAELIRLNDVGIRAVRFNHRRGGSDSLKNLARIANRVREVVGWHVELYIESAELEAHFATLISLPCVSIDHLGLCKKGFNTILRLAEKGVYVKATGFGRVDFDVKTALQDLYAANPGSLVFGTDLPSTRASKAFSNDDFDLLLESLGEDSAARVLCGNASELYRLKLV